MRNAPSVLLSMALFGLFSGCLGKRSQDVDSLEKQRAHLEEEKKRLVEEFRTETRRVVKPPPNMEGEQGIAVAVPNSFTEEIITRALTDVVNGLHLRITDLDFQVGQKVKVKLLAVKVALGAFNLDVLLKDADGVVQAGKPKVSIGDGRIRLEVPLKVVEGRGDAQLRFQWSGRGLTKRVCGNLDVTRDVDGTLKPNEARFRGAATLGVEDHEFVLNPDLPQQKFQLGIEPSAEAWKTFRALLDEKKGACGMALRKADVEGKVRQLLDKGIPVTVHLDELKTIRLPLALSHQVPIQGRMIELSSIPNVLEVGDDYTWLGIGFKASIP